MPNINFRKAGLGGVYAIVVVAIAAVLFLKGGSGILFSPFILILGAALAFLFIGMRPKLAERSKAFARFDSWLEKVPSGKKGRSAEELWNDAKKMFKSSERFEALVARIAEMEGRSFPALRRALGIIRDPAIKTAQAGTQARAAIEQTVSGQMEKAQVIAAGLKGEADRIKEAEKQTAEAIDKAVEELKGGWTDFIAGSDEGMRKSIEEILKKGHLQDAMKAGAEGMHKRKAELESRRHKIEADITRAKKILEGDDLDKIIADLRGLELDIANAERGLNEEARMIEDMARCGDELKTLMKLGRSISEKLDKVQEFVRKETSGEVSYTDAMAKFDEMRRLVDEELQPAVKERHRIANDILMKRSERQGHILGGLAEKLLIERTAQREKVDQAQTAGLEATRRVAELEDAGLRQAARIEQLERHVQSLDGLVRTADSVVDETNNKLAEAHKKAKADLQSDPELTAALGDAVKDESEFIAKLVQAVIARSNLADSWKARLERKEAELTQLREKKLALDQEREELANVIATATRQVTVLHQRIKLKREEMKDKKKEMGSGAEAVSGGKTLYDQARQLEIEIGQMESQLDDANIAKTTAERERAVAESRAVEAERELSKIRPQIEPLRKKAEDSEGLAKEAVKWLRALEKEKKKNEAELDGRVNGLMFRIKELESDLGSREKDIIRITSDLKGLHSAAESACEGMEEALEPKAAKAGLAEMLSSLKVLKEKAEKSLREEKGTNSRLAAELSQKAEATERLQAELAGLRQAKEAERASAHAEVARLEAENKEMNEQRRRVAERIKLLKEEKAGLETLSPDDAGPETLETIAKLVDEIDQLNATNARLDAGLRETHSKETDAVQEKDRLASDLNRLNNMIEEIRRQHTDAVNSLAKEAGTHRGVAARLQDKVDELEGKAAQAERKEKSLEADLSMMMQGIIAKNQQVTEAVHQKKPENEIEALVAERDRLLADYLKKATEGRAYANEAMEFMKKLLTAKMLLHSEREALSETLQQEIERSRRLGDQSARVQQLEEELSRLRAQGAPQAREVAASTRKVEEQTRHSWWMEQKAPIVGMLDKLQSESYSDNEEAARLAVDGIDLVQKMESVLGKDMSEAEKSELDGLREMLRGFQTKIEKAIEEDEKKKQAPLKPGLFSGLFSRRKSR